MEQISEESLLATIRDFNTFCEFIDEQNPKLSARTVTFGKNAAFEVNARLKHRREVQAPNYVQEHYPIVNMLFKLALGSRLYVKTGNEKRHVYLQATERKKEYDALNSFEQYAFLLESFWSTFELDEDRGFMYNPMDQAIEAFAAATPGKPLRKGAFSGTPVYDVMFGLLSPLIQFYCFFGFCTYRPIPSAKPADRYADSIKDVTPTALGVTLSGILLREKFAYWNVPLKIEMEVMEEYLMPGVPDELEIPDSEEEESRLTQMQEQRLAAGYQPLMSYLLSAFPLGTLQRTVLAPGTAHRVLRGNYTFKVVLGKGIWREVQLSGEHTLEDLHLVIQEAYDFDGDHLYAFYMDAKLYSKNAYHGDEWPYADAAVLHELDLYNGQKISYLFDFGDSWEFVVQLIRIAPDAQPVSKPEIIASKGEAPEQYEDEDVDW